MNIITKKIHRIGLLLLCVSWFSTHAQTISSTTIITPVCLSSNGVLQLNFTNVSSYPFLIQWYGSGVKNDTATIYSSTQNINLKVDTNGGTNGYQVYIYNQNFTYLGTYEVGINYDILNSFLSPTCTTPASLNLANIRNGTSPYTVSIEDRNKNTLVSGNLPLSVPFSAVCPKSQQIYLKVTDANGCSFRSVDSGIYVNCKGLNVSLSSINASCTNGKAFITSVSGNTGPYALKWSNGATTDSITNLRKGSYECIVTDSTNCSGIGYAYVSQSIFLNVNSTSKAATCDFPDGEATAFVTGGTSPYTYKWDNGNTGQTDTTLATGVHIVVVEDSKQCTGEGYVFVNSVSPVRVTYTTTASSCTSSTGSATLSISGGQTPYTITWHGHSSTSTTLNSLPPGNHSFTVKDANGCTNSGAVVVPPISIISANIYGTHPICPSTNGSVYIQASSTAGSVTYNWSNGSSSSSITGLTPGTYSCTITDNNGCKVLKSYGLYQKSNVFVNVVSKDASCIFNSDGSAKAIGSGGTAPYTYSWSDGSTGSTISSKAKGRYYVSATDANGCRSTYSSYAQINYNPNNHSCYCEIKGNVYDDVDSNCVKNNNEENIFNSRLNCSNIGSTYTDYNGNYSFKVPAGTYTIEQIPHYSSKLSPCQSSTNTITFTTVGNNCVQTYNYANIIVPYHDIATYPIIYTAPIPGKNFSYAIVVLNNGNKTESSIDATFSEDEQLTFTSSTTTLNALGNGLYKPQSPMVINRGLKRGNMMNYFTPTNLPLGTLIYFRDSVAYGSPISSKWINGEVSPWNNINEYYSTVRSSYDPNQKSVYPQGYGEIGEISLSLKKFTFVVQFENNGTANADKVVVIDSLDKDLDWSTFRPLDASHGVNTFLDSNGVITFTFDRINLAYTPKGVPNRAAQGYVAYTVNAKESVKKGTTIENFADIYFDYNAPIRTNTTLNTYSEITSIEQNTYSEALKLYPNPNNGEMKLVFSTMLGESVQLEIYNIQGQLIDKISQYESGHVINTQAYLEGIYILKVISSNGTVQYIKFMKN
ncbi:MAG: T9SS type A sorting domain-containing protein [Bacteroidia bacterium]|nr:T9SS type A sorting domain-containing protein [Bacteroidia bacterium]